MKQRWLWELKVTSNSSKISVGKVAHHLILAEPVRVTARTRMTSRAGSQFTLNFTLQWSSHAPQCSAEGSCVFQNSNPLMAFATSYQRQLWDGRRAWHWCQGPVHYEVFTLMQVNRKLGDKNVQYVNSEFIYRQLPWIFGEKLKNSDPRTTLLWQWRWF